MMLQGRNRHELFVLLLLALQLSAAVLGLGACGTPKIGSVPDSGVGTPEAGGLRSMKGFELYSWHMEGEWAFALVVGTNRIKTYEELSSSEVRLNGLYALKRELDRLAPGEQVFWLEDRVPDTALPPDDVIRQVRAYCEQRGLSLEIGAGDAS